MAADGEAKRAAQDDRDSWKRTGIIAGALGTGLSIGAGGFGAAAAGALVGGPILGIGLLVTLGLRTNANLKAVEAERKVEDPPRADFLQPTDPVMVLPFRDSFGDSELERALSMMTRVTIETVSLENAMVTAEERMLGARSFQADDAAELRWLENMQLRTAAGRWNLQLAHQSRAMARLYRRDLLEEREFQAAIQAMESLSWEDLEDRDLRGAQQELFGDAIRTLNQAGFPPSSLEIGPFWRKEIGSAQERALELPDALDGAAESAASYGRSLLSSVEIELPGSPPPLSFDFFDLSARYRLGFWSRRFRR